MNTKDRPLHTVSSYLQDMRIDCPRFTTNWRVVIPAYDEEQARRIADRVTKDCGCVIENIIRISDNSDSLQLSECVVYREKVESQILAPAEAMP